MKEYILNNSFYRVPSKSDTTINRTGADASNSSPLCYCMRFSIGSYKLIASGIVSLFSSCCPSNIAGKVTSIVINSLYGMFNSWSCSDVIVKGHEIFSPFWENFNTSSSIIEKVFSSRAMTTTYHLTPRCVFWSATQSMLVVSLVTTFSIKATTALSVFAFKTFTIYINKISTRALTFPSCLIPFVRGCFADYEKTIKSLTCDIFKFVRHDIISWLRFLVSFEVRKAKYQWLSFSGATLSANNSNIFIVRSQ